VEVSRDSSSGLVPVCPPLSTSGLTFVRLSLPQPEIVTSVLVRLYKPRDSSNIGLSQIRLLGSTTFGETVFRTINMDVPDEEQLTKSRHVITVIQFSIVCQAKYNFENYELKQKF
jgi:baculoviral IAP repeat-containing protein 6